MNLNYIGSLAERFMKFRSTVSTEENVSENLFNAISIYLPKSLASNNLATGSYDPSEITADKYGVLTVTVDNYREIMKEGGALINQWLPVFNDGANASVILYVIIFDDTGFTPTVLAGGVSWTPLTKAFNDLYFISFFKTMFSEHYDGSKVEGGENPYDDSNYFDMALALSTLCESESTLSYDLVELKVTVFESGSADTNACKVMSHTKGEETLHCVTLVGSDKEDRASYFWGYLNLIGFKHTSFVLHNGSYITAIVLAKWFETPASGNDLYIGNKLDKIRLTGNKIKPTGLPSPLNTDVNLNLAKAIYEVLDDKNVGYLMSISSSSDNNAQLIREVSGADAMPVTAYMMSKYIDYRTSQDMAEFASAQSTLTNPVLTNENTYNSLQGLLVGNIQTFSTSQSGRLTNVQVNFPPFAEAKQGNRFVGTAVWSATYVGDFEGCEISGSIGF